MNILTTVSYLSFCIIHQKESLCKSALDFKHVIDHIASVANFINVHGLNHRQFSTLLEDMESEYSHESMLTELLENVLKEVWHLGAEIVCFLNMTDTECEFARQQKIPQTLSDFVLLLTVFTDLINLI